MKLHVSGSSSVHHREFIHCTLSNGMSYIPGWSCSKVVYKPVWHIPFLSVQWINSWWWTEELSESCRVSWQNKFVELVHLVGFITRKFVTTHGHMNIKSEKVSRGFWKTESFKGHTRILDGSKWPSQCWIYYLITKLLSCPICRF